MQLRIRTKKPIRGRRRGLRSSVYSRKALRNHILCVGSQFHFSDISSPEPADIGRVARRHEFTTGFVSQEINQHVVVQHPIRVVA